MRKNNIKIIYILDVIVNLKNSCRTWVKHFHACAELLERLDGANNQDIRGVLQHTRQMIAKLESGDMDKNSTTVDIDGGNRTISPKLRIVLEKLMDDQSKVQKTMEQLRLEDPELFNEIIQLIQSQST